MPERVVLVAALAALTAIAVIVVRRWNARRVTALQQSPTPWHRLGLESDGRRTLIAFSTPSCASCHKAQAPAIDLVQARVGADELRVISVDAASQPDVAKAFGIMTVPSTVVIGQSGRIVAVNQGFASSGQLVEQVQHA
jgi:thiol-disulfide isomerase/thioredoxin